MSMFRFLWLRRFIRSNTKPIPENKAFVWKKRLSVAYMLVCWNAFGIVLYQIYTGKADWAAYHGLKTEEEMKLTPGQQAARTLGIEKPNIYRVSGFKMTKIEDNLDTKTEDKINT